MADVPIESNAATRDEFARKFAALSMTVRQATAREIASGVALKRAHDERRAAMEEAEKARNEFFAFVSAAAGFLDERLATASMGGERGA